MKFKKMFVKNEEGEKNYVRFYVYDLCNINDTLREYGAIFKLKRTSYNCTLVNPRASLAVDDSEPLQ
jgi:hypothetical protein